MVEQHTAASSHSGNKGDVARSLFLFAIIYGGMVVLAGVLGNKQVALGAVSALGSLVGVGPLAVEAGIFPFLTLVALSSAVAELHGQSTANRLVLWGFIPLILSIVLTIMVLAIPAAPAMDVGRLHAFETVLGQSPRLMVAGIISYGTSQFLNVTVFSALRGKTPVATQRTLAIAARGAVASALSQVVDTLLFVTIAFYGVFPVGDLLVGQMLAKVVLSLVAIPFVITALVALGRHIDRQAIGANP